MLKNAFIALLLLLSTDIHGQTRSLGLGAKFINDLSLYDGWGGGIGPQLTYRMGKHHGLETGLQYYRLSRRGISFDSLLLLHNGRGTVQRLYLPLLYRYESSLVNFIIGTILDYKLKASPELYFSYYSAPHLNKRKLRLLHTAGISRSFHLGPSLILEPEARFKYTFKEKNGGLELNISLRHQLF